MDEVLKSEILTVVLEKKEGVLFEEFAGLFHQIHGYQFKLSNYGYTSLKKLLEDMKDVVELHSIGSQHLIKCRSPTKHHVVLFIGNNSSQENEPSISQSCSLSTSGPLSGVHLASKMDHAHPRSPQKVKGTNCTTVTKPKSTTSLGSASSSGSSTNSASSTRSESSRSAVASSNPHPKQTKSLTSTLTDANTVLVRNTSKTSAPNKKTNAGAAMKLVPAKQAKTPSHKSATNSRSTEHVRSTIPRVTTSNVFPTTNGPNQKLHFLPNQQIPLRNSSSDLINKSQKVQQVIPQNMSYAAVLANNLNVNRNCQNRHQFDTNNISFNVPRAHTTTVIQSNSRTECSSVSPVYSFVKENIQALLKLHANGLSIFQLQKLYLFKFQQPLAHKASMKQLLLGIKDVVKVQGVGVQMLVFPVPAEEIRSIPTNRHLDKADSLLSTEDHEKNAVVTGPHVSSSLNKHDSTEQQMVSLPLCSDQSSSSGQNQMRQTGGHITDLHLGQIGPMQQILQNTAENGGKINYFCPNVTDIAHTNPFMDTNIFEPPSHVGIDQESKNTEWPALSRNRHALKDIRQAIKQLTLTSVQPHTNESKTHFLSKPMQSASTKCQDQAFNAHVVERPGEKMPVLVPYENVLLSFTNETQHQIEPPSLQTLHQIHRRHSEAKTSYSQTNQDLHETNTKSGPEQNAFQSSDPPQFILHSSGFSFVMGEINVPHEKEATEIKLTVPTADISSSVNDSAQIESDIADGMHGGSVLSSDKEQTISDTHSKMLSQQKKTLSKTQDQMSASYTNKIHQNTEHLLPQPNQPVHDSHSQKTKTNTQNKNVQLGSVSSESQTQHKKPDSQIGNALPQTVSPSSQSRDRGLHLQTTDGQTASPSTKSQHKVPDSQTINKFEQIASPQSAQKVTNSQNTSEQKQTGFPQSQVKVNYLQVKHLIGSASSESQTQQQRPDSQTGNLLQQTMSPSSQSSDKRPNLQDSAVFGQTGSPYSTSQHKIPDSQTINEFGQIVSAQSQQKVTNSQITNEHKETELPLSQVKVNYLKTTNVLGQTTKSPQKVPYSQIIKDFQQIVSPASQLQQFTDECRQTGSALSQSQDKVSGLQTKTVCGQAGTPSSHTKHTRNDFGQVASPASQSREKAPDSLTRNTVVQEESLASQSNQKVLDFQSRNVIGQISSTSQEKECRSPTRNDFVKKESPSSQQKNDINHFFSAEQTKSMSSEKASHLCSSTATGPNQSTPLTHQFTECSTAKGIDPTDYFSSSRPSQQFLDTQNSTPCQPEFSSAQTVLQVSYESSSQEETWQTDKRQSCRIL